MAALINPTLTQTPAHGWPKTTWPSASASIYLVATKLELYRVLSAFISVHSRPPKIKAHAKLQWCCPEGPLSSWSLPLSALDPRPSGLARLTPPWTGTAQLTAE